MLFFVVVLAVSGALVGFLGSVHPPQAQAASTVPSTVVAGVLGSFAGGLLSYALTPRDAVSGALQPAALWGAVLGALAMVALWRLRTRSQRRRW